MNGAAGGAEGLEAELRSRIAGKAKPPGALGRLEELAVRIGLIRGQAAPRLGRAVALVFAGDHGLTAEGISAHPSAVSRAVAGLVLDGRAGISICATAAGVEVVLVDAGLIEALPANPRLIPVRIRAGTRNALREPAMTGPELGAALQSGARLIAALAGQSFDIAALGEIGIGNTSAAALVAHAVTGIDLDTLVGPGAGVPPLGLDHKRAVLARAFARAPTRDARTALSEFGGLEMAMMAGALLAAPASRMIVIVDGFIATAVAAAAIAIEPRVARNCIFAHRSAEPGHTALLAHIGEAPLLDLGLRLGEGSGAALAVPLVRAAAAMLTDMADLADVIPPSGGSPP